VGRKAVSSLPRDNIGAVDTARSQAGIIETVLTSAPCPSKDKQVLLRRTAAYLKEFQNRHNQQYWKAAGKVL
jgi:hypothetical protein